MLVNRYPSARQCHLQVIRARDNLRMFSPYDLEIMEDTVPVPKQRTEEEEAADEESDIWERQFWRSGYPE